MHFQLLLAGIMLSAVAACSIGSVNPPDKRPKPTGTATPASLDGTGKDGRDQGVASEPVPVGGAYLVCAYTTPERATVGCRMENSKIQKYEFSEAHASDVSAMSAEGLPIPVIFSVAPSFSFWHWISITSLQSLPVSRIQLSSRYGTSSDANRISEILPRHPKAPTGPNESSLGDPLAAPPIPNIDQATLSPNGGLETLYYFWFQTEKGQSCEEFCSVRSGLVEAATAGWARDPSFCAEMFSKHYPSRESPVAIVRIPDDRGMGCFTEGDTPETAVLYASSTGYFDRNAKSPKSQRFCACKSLYPTPTP